MNNDIRYSWKVDKATQPDNNDLDLQHQKLQAHLNQLYSPHHPLSYYPIPLNYGYLPPPLIPPMTTPIMPHGIPTMKPVISVNSIKLDPRESLDKNSLLPNTYAYPLSQGIYNLSPGHDQYMPYPYYMANYGYGNPQFNYSKNYFYGKKPGDETEEDAYDKPKMKLKPKIDRFKNKTSDEIVNEFKSFTLPRLRLKRLIKLQAVMRGWYVRKWIIPKKKIHNKLCEIICKNKINEFIEDRIIPDIVLEVIAMSRYNYDYSLYSPQMRNYFEITDDIMQRLIKQLARDIVRDSTSALAQEFLKQRHKGEPQVDNDPFSLTASSLITNFVRKQAQHLARDSLNELVNEYMIESQFIVLLKNKYMPARIKEVAEESINDVAIEAIIDDFLSRMIRELAPAMVQSQYEALVEEAEEEEMDWAVSNHVKREIMTVLIELMRNYILEKNRKEEIADMELKKAKHKIFDEDGGDGDDEDNGQENPSLIQKVIDNVSSNVNP